VIVLRRALFAGAALLSTCAAAAPPDSDRVINAVLEEFARDISAGVRDCVMPSLQPLDFVRRSERNIWGGWLTLDDKSVPASTARQLDRELMAATAPHRQGKRTTRITIIPHPLVLSATDEPATGPCAIEGNKEEVWQLTISRPAITGNLAFVEVSAFADGKSPPPQLWVLELKNRAWRHAYQANRALWYD
jgi:hypothetical protein